MLKIILFFQIISLNYIQINSEPDSLIHDLNLIATNLNKIPITNTSIEFKVLKRDCASLRLKWYNISLNVTNVFGYQIVINENLQKNSFSLNKAFQPIRLVKKNEKNRLYSSQYFDASVNKFKLINLPKNYSALYSICLVIYIDNNDNIQFEKKCIEDFQITNCDYSSDILSTKTFNSTKTTISDYCEQCKYYGYLLIAFIASLVLLTINLIMFTIIIIQNTLKIGIMKLKIKSYRQLLSYKNLTGQSFILNDDKENFYKTILKNIIKESYLDVRKFFNVEKNQISVPSDADFQKSATYKITHPSFILQVPNITQIRDNSSSDISDDNKSKLTSTYYLTGKKSLNTIRPYFGFKTYELDEHTDSSNKKQDNPD
jgi:hypothetical protein